MRIVHRMARPAYERVGAAFRTAYEAAGLRQHEIAKALGVDQATVSKWSRGVQRIDLEYFPVLDELCGMPKGYVLRMAGFVEDTSGNSVKDAVAADPRLDATGRMVVMETYEHQVRRTVERSRSAIPAI